MTYVEGIIQKPAIENKKLAKTSGGYRSSFYTPLQPHISRFPPPPRRLAQEDAISHFVFCHESHIGPYAGMPLLSMP